MSAGSLCWYAWDRSTHLACTLVGEGEGDGTEEGNAEGSPPTGVAVTALTSDPQDLVMLCGPGVHVIKI
ncbi:hypothetical protein GCM10010094_78600 [Streptomyces flaveus]|uniref:Uncharacterized protein n=1 Tax=Streptomyces flaveus TaxID=66370 RepID=A0A917RFX0_9ACTN|nr:hypothetical protein GCM10010094_78600 [Streptomyces flaveus]